VATRTDAMKPSDLRHGHNRLPPRHSVTRNVGHLAQSRTLQTRKLEPLPNQNCNGRRGAVRSLEPVATAKEPQWRKAHCIVLQCNALA
jgi:hypothetical protein